MSQTHRAGGRKTKYSNDFPVKAEGLARQGANDEQIAKGLGISLRVYYEYQQRYPQFREAILRGKAPVDTEVENALLKRCLGYEYNERHIETDSEGKPIKQRVIRKVCLPDVDAIKFWLSKRKRREWGNEDLPPIPVADPAETQQQAERLLESMPFEEREKALAKLLETET